jgi:hypothetical protein
MSYFVVFLPEFASRSIRSSLRMAEERGSRLLFQFKMKDKQELNPLMGQLHNHVCKQVILFFRRKHYSFLQSWRKGYRFPTYYYVRAWPLDDKFMAKLVRSTKLSIQAPFFYTKGQREVEAQHPVVGMDTGLAHTYMDLKLTSDRN